jgi:hypothetical protein
LIRGPVRPGHLLKLADDPGWGLEWNDGKGDTPIRTVINKTLRPVKIPLPGGKTLFLGPSRRGQVSDDALERPAFQKLVESGDIEVLDEKHPLVAEDKMSARTHRSTRGQQGFKNQGRKGDR